MNYKGKIALTFGFNMANVSNVDVRQVQISLFCFFQVLAVSDFLS